MFSLGIFQKGHIMHQKINIVLPERIEHLIEQMADEKSISKFNVSTSP